MDHSHLVLTGFLSVSGRCKHDSSWFRRDDASPFLENLVPNPQCHCLAPQQRHTPGQLSLRFLASVCWCNTQVHVQVLILQSPGKKQFLPDYKGWHFSVSEDLVITCVAARFVTKVAREQRLRWQTVSNLMHSLHVLSLQHVCPLLWGMRNYFVLNYTHFVYGLHDVTNWLTTWLGPTFYAMTNSIPYYINRLFDTPGCKAVSHIRFWSACVKPISPSIVSLLCKPAA